MGVASWLEFGSDGIPMRKWGGSCRLNKMSSGCGVRLGNRLGLCSPGVCNPGVRSWGVDGAASILVCKIGEGRRGKSGVGGLMLLIMKGVRSLDEAGWDKGALSLLKYAAMRCWVWMRSTSSNWFANAGNEGR